MVVSNKLVSNIRNGLDRIIIALIVIVVLLALHGIMTYRPYYQDFVDSGECVNGVILSKEERTYVERNGRHPIEIGYEYVNNGLVVSESYVTIENIPYVEGDSVTLLVYDGYSVIKGV